MASAEPLTPIEFDFLWESLGAGEVPYPLELRSHGVTMAERAGLRARTLADLARRGLVDERGRPHHQLADHFGVLATAEVSVDSVHIEEPNAPAVLGVAGAFDGRGLLAVQDSRGVVLRAVPADGLAGEIVALFPPAPRGRERSITVPLGQLMAGPGADFLQRRAVDPGNGRVGADEDRQALARLHAQPRLRGGQIGANVRSQLGGRSRSVVLSWFDTESGRYLTQVSRGADGREWITIAPADAATLRHRIGEMVLGVRTQASTW
ncbi:MAG: ESX secretion-associated protein EspG [Pseudonocardiaceae bacterium]